MTGTPRDLRKQITHTMRMPLVFGQTGKSLVLGTLPKGAIVTGGAVYVTTAFNSGTSDLIDIGTAGDGQALASAMTLAAVGQIPFDELTTTKGKAVMAADTDILAVYTGSGTAATTGAAVVFLFYVPDNDIGST